MKKFFLWQLGFSIVIVVAYLVSLVRGFGGSSGVCYTMICVALATMWSAHILKVEVIPAIWMGIESAARGTVVASFVLSVITFWIAKKSGASIPTGMIISGAVFFLAMMVVVEASLSMLVLIVVLAVGFGTPLAAALFFFFIALAFAHAIADADARAHYPWMVFAGGVQSVAIYYFFIQTAKFFEHRIVLQ